MRGEEGREGGGGTAKVLEHDDVQDCCCAPICRITSAALHTRVNLFSQELRLLERRSGPPLTVRRRPRGVFCTKNTAIVHKY